MPQARCQILIYDPHTGNLAATISRWRSLNYTKKINDFHTFTLTLNSNDPNVAFFKLDALIEVYRRIGTGAWTLDATFVHRTRQFKVTEKGTKLFISYARGLNDFLRRRSILYSVNTAFTLKSGPADSVMKEFVDENLGPGATNDVRRSASSYVATMPGLRVLNTPGVAPEWSGARGWQNLLEVLKDISEPSSVQFEIVRIGNQGLNFQFSTYYPLRGQDLSNEIMFDPELGNMKNVDFTVSRTEEATVIAVLGPGEEANRSVLMRVSEARGDSPFNIIEATYDARSQPSVDALTSSGDKQLQTLAAKPSFTFEVLQTDSRAYGRDYNVGDRVRARLDTIQAILTIVSATVNIATGKESIALEFVDVSIVE